MTGSRERDDIGWARAILTGLGILAVGLGVAVVGANTVLMRLTSLSRDGRQDVASVLFLGAVIGGAWALRRLQARGVI